MRLAQGRDPGDGIRRGHAGREVELEIGVRRGPEREDPGLGRGHGQAARRCEAVEDEVEGERELQVVVAATEPTVMTDRHGHLGHVRMGLGEARRHRGRSGQVRTLGRLVLEQVLAEPEDPAAQDVQGVVGQLERHATVTQDAHHAIHVGEGRRPGIAPPGEDRGRPRMAEHRRPGGHDRRPQRRRPGAGRCRAIDVVDDGVDHRVEELVLVADVAVQGHRVDRESLGDPPHAHGVEALLVGQVDRGGHDAGAAQAGTRPATGGRAWGVGAGHRRDSTGLTTYGVDGNLRRRPTV